MKGLFDSESEQVSEIHPIRENVQMEGNKMKEIFDYEDNINKSNQQEQEQQEDNINGEKGEDEEVADDEEEEEIIFDDDNDENKDKESEDNEGEKKEEKDDERDSFSDSFEDGSEKKSESHNENEDKSDDDREKEEEKEEREEEEVKNLHLFDFESLIDLPERTNIFTPFDNHFTEYQKLINEQNIYLNPLNIILQHSIVDPLELTYKMVCKVCKEMIFSGYKIKKSMKVIKDYYLTGKGDIYEHFIERIINEVPVNILLLLFIIIIFFI